MEKARETSQIAINIHFIFLTNPLTLIPSPYQSEGGPVTVIGSPCHSGPQKRIEKESNKKLTNELAGLVGESFESAHPLALSGQI